MNSLPPADWHPDPFGRYERRYWDGVQWTEHVTSAGAQSTDPPFPSAPSASPSPVNKRVLREVQQTGVMAGSDPLTGSLLDEPVLIVNQKAKVIEVNVEFSVFNQHGHQIGTIREVGQNLLKKALKVDAYSTRRFQILDRDGQVLVSLVAPLTMVMSKVIVLDREGMELGRIIQKFGIMNSRFALQIGNEKIGTVSGEGWDSWNFNVQDVGGREVARITKKWAGLAAAMFTNTDNYVVEIGGSVKQPLRTLVVAAALVIDTTLRQGQPQAQARALKKSSRRMGDATL